MMDIEVHEEWDHLQNLLLGIQLKDADDEVT
jgi:hypothetical protein